MTLQSNALYPAFSRVRVNDFTLVQWPDSAIGDMTTQIRLNNYEKVCLSMSLQGTVTQFSIE